MACMTGIRKNEPIKKRYAAARAQGRGHYEAMGIVMHKLLRIAFGVLTHQQAFDQSVDEANQQRALEKQKRKEGNQQKNTKRSAERKKKVSARSYQRCSIIFKSRKKKKKS